MALTASAFAPSRSSGGFSGLLSPERSSGAAGLRQLLERRRRGLDLESREGSASADAPGDPGTGSSTGMGETANQGQGNAFGYSPAEFGTFTTALGMMPGIFGLPAKALALANKSRMFQDFMMQTFPMGVTNDLGLPATRGFNPISLSDRVRSSLAESLDDPGFGFTDPGFGIGETPGDPGLAGIGFGDPGFGIGESEGDPGSAGPGDTGDDGEGEGDFHRGGTVKRTGPAKVHEGEEVIRRSEARRIRPALKTINRPGVSGLERLLKGRA